MAAPQTSVGLPANQKTMVIWSSMIITTYYVQFQIPGLIIQWERNSTWPPYHTWGTHDSSAVFGATVAGQYCNFWMTSPVSQTVTIGVVPPP